MTDVKDIYNGFLYDNLKPDEKNNLINSHIQLNKLTAILKRDELKFKNNKYVVGLIYQNVKMKINFIQLSTIFISTIITFIEAVKDQLQISEFYSTIFPVICSSYVALILSISRFYKFEDHKENLSKLFEKNAFVINRLKYKLRLIKTKLPLDPNTKMDDITTFITNVDSDGLQEVITQAYQETDVAIVLKDKLYYENVLFKLHVDSIILKRNLKDLEEHENDLPFGKIKYKISSLRYYLMCYWYGSNYVINEEETFKAIKTLKNIDNNNETMEPV